MHTIIINIGKHFKARFKERFKEQPDLIAYLNRYMTEGLLTQDPQYKGVYFPFSGVYVPIVDNYPNTEKDGVFAKTIESKSFSLLYGNTRKPRRIVWKEAPIHRGD